MHSSAKTVAACLKEVPAERKAALRKLRERIDRSTGCGDFSPNSLGAVRVDWVVGWDVAQADGQTSEL